jgi:tetratricopeptide (TPR) repeat protein
MTEPSAEQDRCPSLQGRRIHIVGRLASMPLPEAFQLIREAGGQLVERVDGADLVVIGADEFLLDEYAVGFNEWLASAAENGSVEIVSEPQLCQSLGLVDDDRNLGQLYTPGMLADLLRLPIATIRRWHRRGLIRPVRQIKQLAYYDFQEVATARRIAKMVASGATPQLMETKLSRLAQLYPNLQRPLSQLSVIVEGEQILLRQGEGLIEPGGQMRLCFDPVDPDLDTPFFRLAEHRSAGAETTPDDRLRWSAIPSNERFSDLTTPAEFLALAGELEDRLEIDSAIDCYRAMMLSFGPSADVCFRLAELLYQQGDLVGARERYYVAIELNESFVEARASLGCVLTELKQPELAIAAFKGALTHHSEYPDVHFHLARLLDDRDHVLEAEYHWKHFLKLAPQSPWADLARLRLGLKQ